MTTDVVNTGAEKLFSYPAWITRISGGPDPPDTVGEITSDLRAASVVQSAGGQVLDHASLEWWVTSDLINRNQPANFQRMIDVLLPDGARTRVALGDYVTEFESVDDSQVLTAQSQLRGYHFGKKFTGQIWWDDALSEEVQTQYAPVFNPRVDGRILGNMSHKFSDVYFIHPEATLTDAAIEEAGGLGAKVWSLSEAIAAMCQHLNLDEEFIENPAIGVLRDILSDAPIIEAIELPLGESLPYYLDMLLQPLGYNWYVDYATGISAYLADVFYIGAYDSVESAGASSVIGTQFFNTTTGTMFQWDGDNWIEIEGSEESIYAKTKPQIVVFQKGVGEERELNFQSPGSVLDLATSNCNKYSVMRRIGDSVNQVKVIGNIERAEVTIELVRGWLTEDDEKTASQLDKSDPESEYILFPTTWRLWVANESGDYTGTRIEIEAALDLSSVFSRWLPHRREAEDPFTYQGSVDGKKQRRQIFVEYTTDIEALEVKWVILPDDFGQPFVLPDQIGILFTGNTPPEALIGAGDKAGVRITCVVAGDAKLVGDAARKLIGPVNGRVVELVLDMPQKFRKNWVQKDGDYASTLALDEAGAETADDSIAITTYAEKIRDDHEVAELDCEFSLPGLHIEYKIGDLITKINGREISLDQASVDATLPRYPQITKIEWRYNPGPETILTVDRGVRKPDRSKADGGGRRR